MSLLGRLVPLKIEAGYPGSGSFRSVRNEGGSTKKSVNKRLLQEIKNAKSNKRRINRKSFI